MINYYVNGGVYADLNFDLLQTLESYGPFDTYREAFDVWQAKARFNVDNACHRLEIVTLALGDEVIDAGC
jgi:hypothetical protein